MAKRASIASQRIQDMDIWTYLDARARVLEHQITALRAAKSLVETKREFAETELSKVTALRLGNAGG